MSNTPQHYAPVRRILTGHNAAGESVIAEDAASPFSMHLPGVPSFGVTDLWKIPRTPFPLENTAETCAMPIQLAPPAGGNVLRIVEFPPDASYLEGWDRERAFGGMGDSGHAALAENSQRHAAMHKTSSVDYAIVLSGEIWAVMDLDETLMKAGDVLIQRGTNHAWSNRSAAPCRVAFVLTDAR
jgi:mannose-6-phosphate isomerase-like protein (cupin superfamily)